MTCSRGRASVCVRHGGVEAGEEPLDALVGLSSNHHPVEDGAEGAEAGVVAHHLAHPCPARCGLEGVGVGQVAGWQVALDDRELEPVRLIPLRHRFDEVAALARIAATLSADAIVLPADHG